MVAGLCRLVQTGHSLVLGSREGSLDIGSGDRAEEENQSGEVTEKNTAKIILGDEDAG